MTWESFATAAGSVATIVGLVALPVKYVATLGKRMTAVERDQKWLIQSTSKHETMLSDVKKEVAEVNVEVASVKATTESTDKKVDLVLSHLIGKVE